MSTEPTRSAEQSVWDSEINVAVLVERGQQGDETVLPQLRALLDENPSVWQECSDLARHVVRTWIETIAGTDLVVRESLQRRVAAMRDSFAGDTPTLVEQLLIERILIAWLQCIESEIGALNANRTSPRMVRFHAQRQDAAGRGFNAAVKALGDYRKLQDRAAAQPKKKRPEKPTADGRTDAAADINDVDPVILRHTAS